MAFRALQKGLDASLLAAALLVCAIGLSSCGASSGNQPTSNAVTLKSLSISPHSSTVMLGSGQQFTVSGLYSDGSQRDLTQTANWSSTQPTIAAISAPGMAVSKQPGTVTITAASGSVNSSAILTVSSPTLASIAVSPSSPSVPKGETQQFTATATFSDKSTQDVTSNVTWTSSSAVTSISSDGLATALKLGTATITATSGSISGTDTLTVTAPVLTSLSITPANSSVGLGTNEQLSATGTFSDSSTQDVTSTVTWASAKPAVATIATSGLATTWSIGKTGISASSGSMSAAGTVTVLPVAAVEYFSNAHNINAPDGSLNLVNTGLTDGDLCAMVYVFDSSQEMNECCGCLVSQEAGMRTLSVNNDLTSNTLTGATLSTGVIRVIPADAASNPTCNAGAVTPSGLVLSWATHIQYYAPGTFQVTENDPRMPPLSQSELTNLESDCAFMQKLGSGHGICSCGVGD